MIDSNTTRVSVVTLDDYEPTKVNAAIRQLLTSFKAPPGHLNPKTPSLIKPNFLSPRSVHKAVCTHPELIRSLARFLHQQGAPRSLVSDSPGIGSARNCARKLGLSDDETLVVVNADDPVHYSVKGDTTTGSYNKLPLSRRMVESRQLINIAKAKTHGQMVITGAVKNTFGAMVGLEKAQLHFRAGRSAEDFASIIVDIHEKVAPALNIVDGVIAMEGNGPGSGDPRQLGLLLAGTNAHAIDWILCKIWGIDPGSVYTLRDARNKGLLPPEADIELLGADLNDLIVSPPWKPARPMFVRRLGMPGWMLPTFDRLMTLRPKIDETACIGCGECVTVCAAKAMTMDRDRPVVRVDNDKCISCFCCQEMCPHGAISVNQGLLSRILGLGKN